MKYRLGLVSIAGAYCVTDATEQHEKNEPRLMLARLEGKATGEIYCAVQPPSTGSAAPVIDWAPSVARKTATAPISSTVTKRRVG